MFSTIECLTNKYFPLALSIRKELHRHPEIAWTEFFTSKYIADCLKNMGYHIIKGEKVAGEETGVIAELVCRPSTDKKKVFALRFDIDALPISESHCKAHRPFRDGFISENEGCMHACGHDGHTAIGLALAQLLMDIKDSLSGCIRLIFQPAEEGARGAIRITERGWLDDADYFMAGHIFNRPKDLAPNCNVICGVAHSLATTKSDIRFYGKKAHAAHPEQGLDVMPAMADAILQMKQIPSPGFIQIGRVKAGNSRNIIADIAHIEMETRAPHSKRDRELNILLNKILKNIENKYHVSSTVTLMGSAPSLESDPEFVEELISLYRNKSNILHPAAIMYDFPASEDAAHMMEKTKGHGGKASFLLFPTDLSADLHHDTFDFPDEVLAVAISSYALAVYQKLKI